MTCFVFFYHHLVFDDFVILRVNIPTPFIFIKLLCHKKGKSDTLEEYVERFQYNLQRSPYASSPLLDNVLKSTSIKGMKEQWIETLNIMGKGDIYQ